MAVGAREFIDKLLVDKYASQQVDNHDENALVSKVDADDMLNAMNVTASSYKNMLHLNNRLTMVCYGVISKSVKYVKTENYASA